MTTEGHEERRRKIPPRAIALLLFIIGSGAFGVVAITQGWIQPSSIQEAAADAGPLAWLVFVIAVIVLEILWVPRAWGLFAGGALFGPVIGSLLSFVADMCGAMLCYWIGRGGGREWASRAIQKRPKAARLVDVLAARRGIVTVAVLRLVPLAHYTAVSYAAGVTGVSFVQFVIGNAIGLVPYALLYPFVGHSAFEPTSPEFLVGLAIMLVIFAVTAVLARKIFRE